MGIIEDLQEAKKRAERNGTQGAKFLVNQKTYNALCRRGADKSMLIVSGLVKDGDCVMVKENTGVKAPVLLPEKGAVQRQPERRRKKCLGGKKNGRSNGSNGQSKGYQAFRVLPGY